MNDEEVEKEFTLKIKIIRYLKRLLIVLAFNGLIAGIIMIASHFLFQTGLNTECFANSMLGLGIVYLINCYMFFQRDIYEYQSSANRAFKNPRISERKISNVILGGFSNSEALFFTVSCAAFTIGIAYLIAIH